MFRHFRNTRMIFDLFLTGNSQPTEKQTILTFLTTVWHLILLGLLGLVPWAIFRHPLLASRYHGCHDHSTHPQGGDSSCSCSGFPHCIGSSSKVGIAQLTNQHQPTTNQQLTINHQPMLAAVTFPPQWPWWYPGFAARLQSPEAPNTRGLLEYRNKEL